MKCKEIMSIFEKIAPKNYAESYDNVGLLVGDENKEVKKIMIALDSSKNVVEQAINENVDMLITHHPMIFHSIKRITKNDFLGNKIIELAKNDISYFATHTNMDAAVISVEVAKKLCLKDTKPIEVVMENNDKIIGNGSIGSMEESITLKEFAVNIKKIFDVNNIRVIGDLERKISTVAILPGSGKSFLNEVIGKADVYVTGDIDHHTALDAIDQNMCMIDAGHFDTEYFVVEYMKNFLNNKFGNKLEVVIAMEKSPYIYM